MFFCRNLSAPATTGSLGLTPLRNRPATTTAVTPGPAIFGANAPSGVWAVLRKSSAFVSTPWISFGSGAAPPPPACASRPVTIVSANSETTAKDNVRMIELLIGDAPPADTTTIAHGWRLSGPDHREIFHANRFRANPYGRWRCGLS